MRNMFNRKTIILGLAVVVVLALGVGAYYINTNYRARRVANLPNADLFPNFPDAPDAGEGAQTSEVNTENLEDAPLLSVVATGLDVPWSLAFLPDGSAVFTERGGNVRFIDSAGKLVDEPIKTFPDVVKRGEAGFLGVEVHPDFATNNFVYFYYTQLAQEIESNRVVRYKFNIETKALSDEKLIIGDIPAERFHDGGRLKFGPDKLLYITTGDALNPNLAQDITSLAGKILRLNEGGSLPDGQTTPIYSYGHRNPQGLAWNTAGELFATEHGQSAHDEVNLILQDHNYGWSIIQGDETAEGMQSPLIHSADETWAPSGIAYSSVTDSFFFAGLRGQTLYELKIENGRPNLTKHLEGQLGRLRDVVEGPDGFLYVLTSNRDGRGLPKAEDDQIVRVNPTKLGL